MVGPQGWPVGQGDQTLAKKWAPPTNNDGTLVNEAETIVRAVRSKFIADVNALTQEVVGKSGRPFMAVPLSKAERLEQFKQFRELDDPEVWKQQLEAVKHNPAALKRLLKSWSESEADWQDAETQQVIANAPGLTPGILSSAPPPEAPLAGPEPSTPTTPTPPTEPVY